MNYVPLLVMTWSDVNKNYIEIYEVMSRNENQYFQDFDTNVSHLKIEFKSKTRNYLRSQR